MALTDKIRSYAENNAPWGCTPYGCMTAVTEADYAAEKSAWVQGCVGANNKFLRNKNRVASICDAEFNRVTSPLRYDTHTENFNRNTELYNLSLNSDNTVLYIALVIVVGLILYFTL